MEVIVPHQQEFNSILRRLRNAGGEASQAFQRISVIRQSLEADLDDPGRLVNQGESRIPNCRKYRLTDSYRLVTVQTGGFVVFLYAGKHDDAEKWLNKNRGMRVTIDPGSSRISFVVANEDQPNWAVPAVTAPQAESHPLLPQLNGVDWANVIPSRLARQELLSFTQDTSQEEIETALSELAQTQAAAASFLKEILILLRDGNAGAARERANLFVGKSKEVVPETPIPKEVLSSAANSDSFVVLSDLSDEEWERWLDPTKFQDWMIFLHPGQKRIVDEDFDRPAFLGGVSGSGKTCVLVHRARRLALEDEGKRVLILTLNRSLARLIDHLVNRLCAGERPRIQVMAFYDYLQSVLSYWGAEAHMQLIRTVLKHGEAIDFFLAGQFQRVHELFLAREEDEIRALWKEFVDQETTTSLPEMDRLEVYLYGQDAHLNYSRYLYEELTLIRSAHRNWDGYSSYLEYERRGRAIQFQTNRREDALIVLRAWEEHQLRSGKLDHMGLTQSALLALEERQSIPDQFRFDHVLVDEFQDFSTLDFEILRLIPKSDSNGLFATGDLAQRIYAKDLNLASAQLGTANRVNRYIKKNFRNTKQILQAAHHLVVEYPPANSAGDETVILDPEYAQREGPMPFIVSTDDQIKAAWSYAKSWLDAGFVGFSVCIATADSEKVPADAILRERPERVSAVRLSGDYVANPEAVVVSDIASVKGFEFSLIIVVGLQKGAFPADGVPVQEHWRDALRLYVAMTRGRDEVRLLHEGEASPFLEAIRKFCTSEIFSSVNRASEGVDAGEDQNDLERPEPDFDDDLEDSAENLGGIFAPATELNGYSVIRLRKPVTQNKLAAALNTSEIQIGLDLQEAGAFLTAISEIEDHIIRVVLAKRHCVPLFIGQQRASRLRRGQRTREEVFRVPILRVLAEMSGGRGRMGDVLDRVHDLISETLKPVDYERLNSGSRPIRWRNTAQFARNALKDDGLLSESSPHGIWEISDAGRKYLEKDAP